MPDTVTTRCKECDFRPVSVHNLIYAVCRRCLRCVKVIRYA